MLLILNYDITTVVIYFTELIHRNIAPINEEKQRITFVGGKPVFYWNWQHSGKENIYNNLSCRGEIVNRNEVHTNLISTLI